METFYVVGLTLLAVAGLKLLLLLIASKGQLGRWGLATQVFFRVLGDAKTTEKAQALLAPPEASKTPRLSSEPIRLLTMLQREGRLLDFLLEDVSGASDEQLGAGVREVHRKSQQVLRERLTLEPVLSRNEGEIVEIAVGFDPSAIQLTGNVTGTPPFRGELKHRGWRVRAYSIPVPPPAQDDLVLAPAQVELS